MTREEAFKKAINIVAYFEAHFAKSKEAREDAVNIIEVLEQEPCEDVIRREDALQALCKAVHKNDDTIPCPNQRVSCLWSKTKVQDYAEEIWKLPSVNSQPKTGHWIRELIRNEKGGCIGAKMICSECGNDNKHDEYMNYCPNCGKKMDERREVRDKV